MADIICYKSDGQILDYYTQWDVGQQLMIKGVDLSSAPYFYFTNSISDTAYVMPSEVSNGAVIVNVPDVLLQDAVPLIVYISYNQDNYIGTTEHTVRIPVMPRAKPNDYIYDPDSGGSGGGSGGSTGEAIGIANNLTTNDSTMALSAAQGVVLKAMVDTLGSEKVSTDSLPDEIKSALDQAIADGEIVGVQGEPGKDGEDGRGIESVLRTSGDGSPGTTDIYTITYSDNTTSSFSVYNGANGEDGSPGSVDGGSGSDGATFTPHIDEFGNLSWSNDKGLDNPETVNIIGKQGKDGVSVTHSWDGTKLFVTSASGTSSADLKGSDGIGVEKAYQSVVSSNDGGENVFTIVLSDGTSSEFTIKNGSRGRDGEPGGSGVGIYNIEQLEGSDEGDGVSVIKVILTDGREYLFDVKNGSNGSNGADGIDGKNGVDGVGIKSVEQTTTSTDDDGNNTITIRLTNDESYTFNVQNGSKGSQGLAGADAKINGVNSLTINSGNGIVVSQSGSNMTISSNYTYGTHDPGAGSYLASGQLYFVYE